MTDAALIAHMHETTRRQDVEIATLRALLADLRVHIAPVRMVSLRHGDMRGALLTRIDAALSPTVPTRPDLSPSQSPLPAGDSGGRETT